MYPLTDLAEIAQYERFVTAASADATADAAMLLEAIGVAGVTGTIEFAYRVSSRGKSGGRRKHLVTATVDGGSRWASTYIRATDDAYAALGRTPAFRVSTAAVLDALAPLHTYRGLVLDHNEHGFMLRSVYGNRRVYLDTEQATVPTMNEQLLDINSGKNFTVPVKALAAALDSVGLDEKVVFSTERGGRILALTGMSGSSGQITLDSSVDLPRQSKAVSVRALHAALSTAESSTADAVLCFRPDGPEALGVILVETDKLPGTRLRVQARVFALAAVDAYPHPSL